MEACGPGHGEKALAGETALPGCLPGLAGGDISQNQSQLGRTVAPEQGCDGFSIRGCALALQPAVQPVPGFSRQVWVGGSQEGVPAVPPGVFDLEQIGQVVVQLDGLAEQATGLPEGLQRLGCGAGRDPAQLQPQGQQATGLLQLDGQATGQIPGAGFRDPGTGPGPYRLRPGQGSDGPGRRFLAVAPPNLLTVGQRPGTRSPC